MKGKKKRQAVASGPSSATVHNDNLNKKPDCIWDFYVLPAVLQ
jgi:hypothetical protein